MTPPSTVGSRVWLLSWAAWASGIFAPQSEPPERKGTPRRLASWAMPKSTRAGSGVPKVGAPDCMEMELAKLPRITGAPGRTSWPKAMPAMASARVWVRVPTGETGDMAPARMKGVTMVAWLARA